MKTNKEIKMKEVFAGSALQANMIKSMLEDTEIEVFLKDEFMGTLNPWYTSPGGAGAVTVCVSSEDYEKAKIVVESYENNLRENN